MRRVLLISHFLLIGYTFASGQQTRDNQPSFIIKPYLQYSTQTEMSLLWETSHPSASLIEFGQAKFDSGHAYQLFRFYLHDELKIEEYSREVDDSCEVFLEKGLHPVKLEYYLSDRYALYWQFTYTDPVEKRGLVSDFNFYYK